MAVVSATSIALLFKFFQECIRQPETRLHRFRGREIVVRKRVEGAETMLEDEHCLLLEAASLGRSPELQAPVQAGRHVFEEDGGHANHGSISVVFCKSWRVLCLGHNDNNFGA